MIIDGLTQAQTDGLIAYARRFGNHYGMDALMEFKHEAGPCACMGPRSGEPFCPCNMDYHLEENLTSIVSEIDPDAALIIMRRNLIRALRG